MSVPENKRTESKLEVQTKAIELADYTTSICANEKTFPKRHRWTITCKIVDASLEIMGDVHTANSVFVASKVDYEVRRECQVRALAHTAKLLGLMELAYAKFSIDDNRIKHWTQLAYDTRELIKKWKKSDSDRYKQYH